MIWEDGRLNLNKSIDFNQLGLILYTKSEMLIIKGISILYMITKIMEMAIITGLKQIIGEES